MIVLGTNGLSEPMRAEPGALVKRWFGGQPAASLFTTAITEGEIRSGVAILPMGRRRSDLIVAMATRFDADLAGRFLSFDFDAARTFAEIAALRRKNGRPILHADAQITVIAKSRGAAIATRNVADFAGCGVASVNPWKS